MTHSILTHMLSTISESNRGWKSMRKPIPHLLVRRKKILANKLLRCEMWVDKFWFSRLRSLGLRVLLQLLRVCVLRVLGQPCEGSQSTPCAWGVLSRVRVVRWHAPEPRVRSMFPLTDRVCRRNTSAHRPPASACCISSHETHVGIVDVASVPRQDSAA